MEARLLPFGGRGRIDAKSGAFDHPIVRGKMFCLQELRKDLLQHRAAGRREKPRASDHRVKTVKAKDVSGVQLVEAIYFEAGRARDCPCQAISEDAGAEQVHFVDEAVLSFALWVLDGDDAHRANLPCVGDAMRFAGAAKFDLLPKVLASDSVVGEPFTTENGVHAIEFTSKSVSGPLS
jgi:hypothetical protein